jgi:hypothetical protein
MSAHGGPFDVLLDFAQRTPDDTGDPQPDVRIAMSWEHLSTVIPILERLLESYKREMGALPDVVGKLDIKEEG